MLNLSDTAKIIAGKFAKYANDYYLCDVKKTIKTENMAKKKIPRWRKDAESDLLFFLRNYNELKHNLRNIESLIDYYVELLKQKD